MNVATPRGAGAVMASRITPPDSLEFFPTPPWATRALFEFVLPRLGIESFGSVREPACGEGHMAAVCDEYATRVMASDVFDYGIGAAQIDFLDTMFSPTIRADDCDLVITNPPFRPAADFAERALGVARHAVCLLLRTQWIEGSDRYERLFRDRPPTLFAPFVERVPMIGGRYDPDASTATGYSWFCWKRGAPALPVFWIPPRCRRELEKKDDRARFAPWSIMPDDPAEVERIAREICRGEVIDPEYATVNVAARQSLTYREARALKPEQTQKIIEIAPWRAQRRAADDLIARRLIGETLRRAA